MVQVEFAEYVKNVLIHDKSVIGLAVAGSWLTNEIDKYSDLDLILVTKEKIGGDKNKMLAFAEKFGQLLSGFTGEHVGEPRVLICLYDNPLLHVDIKFVTLEEFHFRIETPVILLDTDGKLQEALNSSTAKFPYPDYQWIEDRFWIWIHYVLLKIGRGELFEAYDFLAFLRMIVFGPLFHIKNKNLPRGVRRVEMQIDKADFAELKSTLPIYDKQSILESLQNAVFIYQKLRLNLFDNNIVLQNATEQRVLLYFEEIKQQI
ncbi:nucleotidyltransferase domain-containing protein [Emticicia sp. SJ17W-69]|uniref:nucleotidyltransferase domain-containing protein n=1 Tax=Emticicia sp. SJ17W-69 TaxID=3421657 RepID=UPI003EB8D033